MNKTIETQEIESQEIETQEAESQEALNEKSNTHPYASLTPDLVMDAVESCGLLSDARVFALNSYENRVYQVGIENASPLIAKFYRPNRWTREQILEEHSFTQALKDLEISVVAPLFLNQPPSEEKKTLLDFHGFHFSLFARQGGHAPNLDDPDSLLILGRTLGRIHAMGAAQPFQHRPTISVHNFARESYEFLIEQNFIPANLLENYKTLGAEVIVQCEQLFERTQHTSIRLHGDCHPGNVLWRDDLPHFVDFDDARNGPAVQDLWMLLTGDRENQRLQLSEILEGYQEFFDFNYRELQLIEALRSMRIMHYSAWLARRWNDPAFPRYFPWFNTEHYWSQHILELREQLIQINEKSLSLY